MPCRWIKFRDKDGNEHVAHVKLAAPRKRKCAFCGCPDAKALCDYPTGPGKTCDKPCCSNCRQHVGPDRDYCRDHWDFASREAQGKLFA
jgi:hypothetical protein